MIRPSPTNPSGRALLLVVDLPGEVDAAVLSRHLWPLPRLTGTAAYAEWRRAALAQEGPSRAKAARILGRLQEAGLVETAGAPRLAEWFVRRMEVKGLRAALLTATFGEFGEAGAGIEALVLRAVENPPGSVADLLGPKPSGARQAVYRRACEIGVVIPPSRRVATDLGRELVAAWARP